MKSFALIFFTLTFSVFAQVDQRLPNGKWAYYGDEFYAAASTGSNLEKSLFLKILNSTHTSIKGKADFISPKCSASVCYAHTSIGYDEARKVMFGTLDILRDAKGTYVLDVYCGEKFYFRSLEEASNMHAQVNIEHTWPQSRFSPSFPKEMQKSDMHHLYLTDSMANNVRGNSPFGLLAPTDDRMGGQGCRNSRSGFVDDINVYTPPAQHRGNVARSLFYFSMHYNLPISKSEEETLRRWHKADPIDAAELRRHDLISKIEKVRNPFVDYPELVDHVSDF